jgi:hypothetical protein
MVTAHHHLKEERSLEAEAKKEIETVRINLKTIMTMTLNATIIDTMIIVTATSTN